MTRAVEEDIVFEQGATHTVTWDVEDSGGPVDLTAYSARMQVRSGPRRDAGLWFTFTSEEDSGTSVPVLELNVGSISITFPSDWSDPLIPFAGYFDVRLTAPDGAVEFTRRGRFILLASITAPA
jgi:hypothetical protein